MKVSELFERLSYGEFSNLALSGEGSGTIEAKYQPKYIQYINSCLLELYGQFVLNEKFVLLRESVLVTNYYFRKEFAETSGSSQLDKYIRDTPNDPFLDDLIRVLGVEDDKGFEYKLNDRDDPRSLFTPQQQMLQVPEPINGRILIVTYQARHEPLVQTGERVLAQNINVPFFLENAVQNFVAHKHYSHMNGEENQLKSAEYLATYQSIVSGAEEKDLMNGTSAASFNKLEQRGFI